MTECPATRGKFRGSEWLRFEPEEFRLLLGERNGELLLVLCVIVVLTGRSVFFLRFFVMGKATPERPAEGREDERNNQEM